MSDEITVPTLGRAAHIGSLYDFRTHQILTDNLFKKRIPDEAILSCESSSSHYVYNKENSFSSRFRDFDIRGDLSLSILSGTIPLGGSASYINKDNSNENLDRFSVIWKNKKWQDTLNLNFEGLTKFFIPRDSLVQTKATHFVAGVRYGANVVIDCVYSKAEIGNPEQTLGFNSGYNPQEKSYKEEKEGSSTAKSLNDPLSPELKKLNINYKNKSGNQQTYQSLKIEILCDMIATPMCTNSIERVQTYLEDFKNELSNTKGVPVELILKPISSLPNVHNAISIKETMLDECKKIQEIYDKIIKTKFKVDQALDAVIKDDFKPKQKLIESDKNELISIERFQEKIKKFKKTECDLKNLKEEAEAIIKKDENFIAKWDLPYQVELVRQKIQGINSDIRLINEKIDAGQTSYKIRGKEFL